ncbi:hypothetical protein [Streptomyces sp. NPDC088847]|uniref:hypothetical protein n=1 Tax=Streptomyces sp. NPDC088847 TaxID=3365909 RepID=UPI003801DF58
MVAQCSDTTVTEAARPLGAYVHDRRPRLTDTVYALVTRAMTPAAVADARPRL